ncbi:hypothetical protein DLJ47_23125 [Micromonospora sp. S4605]|nr:hypothetical protein DLJ47_23125 [Micromonospora sp. S4605]
MWPQSGDAFLGSVPAFHAVPWLHSLVPPSPVDQVTVVGVPTAVTDRPARRAVADRGDHTDPSIHSQVGTYTTWGAGGAGFNRIRGAGNFR